jgi:alpha-1,2-mannosyltransferase
MTSNEPACAARDGWPQARLTFWVLAALAILCWRGPALADAFKTTFFRPRFFLPDFFQEWASARNALDGYPVYTPHKISVKRLLNLPVDESDPYFIILKENVHPPCAVLLGIPFGLLDFQDALVAWNLASLVLFAASLWLIVRTLRLSVAVWQVLAGFCVLLVFYPLQDHIMHGQLDLVLLFLLTMAWRADRRGQSAMAGVWTGAATAVKLFPGLLLLYFLVLRKWRALVWTILTGAALSLTAGVVLGFDSFPKYFLDVTPRTTEVRARWDNYSLPAISFKLFEQCDFPATFAVGHIVLDSRLAWASAALCLTVFLAILGWLMYRIGTSGDTDRAFALTVSAMLLANPITWVHYFLLLTLPVFIVWPRLSSGRREILVFLLAIVAAPPWKLVEYALILLHGDPNSSGPWQTLTALSLPCYAQLGVFVLTALASADRSGVPREPAREDSA